MSRITLSLLAAALIAIGAPAAQAAAPCTIVPGMCPPSGSGGNNSAPEPGTLGLLALGAAASIGLLRKKKS